jgi:uncharacterized Fe-S cluster protein YjdI
MSTRPDIEKHYSNGELTVVWKPKLCIHSRRCSEGLPGVFDPDKRPWITITGAASAEIATQVRRCPSGALSLLGDPPFQRPIGEHVDVAVQKPRAESAAAPVSHVARAGGVSRDLLLHRLHEAAELEHTLMCTYLYAAFTLRQGVAEGLTPSEAEATARWRRTIIGVAVEEMGHLAAVWNITSAVGGSPRFGRSNLPVDPGLLPASVVAKLAPFDESTIQHFVHLERPADSDEPEGAGFAAERSYVRASNRARLTPMAVDYETVGVLYAAIEDNLRALVDLHGETSVFCGDTALQLSPAEVALTGATPVVCLKSALAALVSIVEQGEGSPGYSEDSHCARFTKVRQELLALRQVNPAFQPAFPAATNPALRQPLHPAGRVWIQDEDAAKTVDLANACYALMLRLLAYSYVVPNSSGEKGLAVSLAMELMRAVTVLGERAARLPAGPSHPDCNAGMSFTTLRDSAPFSPGVAARRFFTERFAEIAAAAAALGAGDARSDAAARITASVAERATAGFAGG